MIYILVAAVAGSILISGFCSLMEAALYAVPRGYVKHLAESGSRTGKLLLSLKSNISKPIAAILILNTIANTAGASIAGWAFGEIYGSDLLAVFSGMFTLAILYFSEIVPKTVGVVFCKPVSHLIVFPLKGLILLTSPLIMISEGISKVINRRNNAPRISTEEILSIANIGTEEGVLDDLEGSVIQNVIGLDAILIKDILTPRVVVFRHEENATLSDLDESINDWSFSRVPIYSDDDPDNLIAYVTQRDIYRELLKGNTEITLKELGRPLQTVPELIRADKLLLEMFESKEHICAVVDEHGGLAGIVTLEDIIEEIVGQEIVDEYDTVSDLRTFAQLLRLTRHRRSKKTDSPEDND